MATSMVKGNCYGNSGELVLNEDFNKSGRKLTLVHALVTGCGGKVEGQDYSHAFVIEEFEDRPPIAIDSYGDTVEPFVMALNEYRVVGNVRNEIKYSTEELAKKLVEHNHWGPWDMAYVGDES